VNRQFYRRGSHRRVFMTPARRSRPQARSAHAS
jgi:hypothetical protein